MPVTRARRVVTSRHVQRGGHPGPSHDVLPQLPERRLDLVLLDGAHGFPYPILDWWYVAPRVRIGGAVLLDDAYMPPVRALLDGLEGDPAWELEGSVGYRTAILRKGAASLPPFDWNGSRIGGGMSFRYLPPAERAGASARHRVFRTRLGLGLVGVARR